MLAMYNLSLEGTGRQGYFRWKEDICAFISRHWTFLLGSRSVRETAHTHTHVLYLGWCLEGPCSSLRTESQFTRYVLHVVRPNIVFFWGGSRKKTSTWWSTVAGCLSVGSPTFFRSGAQEFGEPGWWKLVQNRPPTLRPDGDKASGSSLKAKGRIFDQIESALL